MMQRITVTVKQLFDALESNGFEHLRGTWFKFGDDGAVIGGCVLGQAAINLGAYEYEQEAGQEGTVTKALSRFPATQGRWTEWNTKSTIDRPVNVASQIIYWNDVVEPLTNEELGLQDEEENQGIFNDPKTKYVLPTWPEVVEMARDCLTPYFDETIELAQFDWVAPRLHERLGDADPYNDTYAEIDSQ